jgi:hypothetical protein
MAKKPIEILDEIKIEDVKSGDIVGINHKTYLYMNYRGKHKLIFIDANKVFEYDGAVIDKVFKASNGKCIKCRKDIAI